MNDVFIWYMLAPSKQLSILEHKLIREHKPKLNFTGTGAGNGFVRVDSATRDNLRLLSAFLQTTQIEAIDIVLNIVLGHTRKHIAACGSDYLPEEIKALVAKDILNQ